MDIKKETRDLNKLFERVTKRACRLQFDQRDIKIACNTIIIVKDPPKKKILKSKNNNS